MTNGTCSGFTLLELLTVAAILALAAAVATPIFFDKTNQTCFQRTVETMAEIEKAILGVTSDRVKGDVRFGGYVQDMGELPELFYITQGGKAVGVKEDEKISQILKECKYPPQPKGLWTNDPEGTPDREEDDLIVSKTYWYEKLDLFRVGWHGPYLKPPSGGVVVDGWGNPFVFENVKGSFTITSLGADGKQEGEGFDSDIVHTIRKLDYMGTVSGYVSPQSVSLEECKDYPAGVRIYYTPATSDCEKDDDGYKVTDCVGYMETTAKPDDGYFRFESVPVGTERLLLVAGETTDESGYKIAVEPGAMWLGTLGVVH